MTLLVTRGDGNTREILASIPFTTGDVWLSVGVHIATDFRYAVQFDRTGAALTRAGLYPGAVVRSTEDFKNETTRHREVRGGGVGSGGKHPAFGRVADTHPPEPVMRNRPTRAAPTGPADSGRFGGNAGHPAARLPVDQRAPASRPVAARGTPVPRGGSAGFIEGRRDTRLTLAEEYERSSR